MAKPLNFKGRVKAKIIDHNCEFRKGKHQIGIMFVSTAFFCRRTTEDQGDPTWRECPPAYQMEIVGTFYLMKNDGSRNDFAIESLAKAIPDWDGDDLDAWNAGKFIGKEVQIETRDEEYNGVKSIKVAFINPLDYEPGFQHPTTKFGKLSVALTRVKPATPAHGAQGQGENISSLHDFSGLEISEENVPF